MDEARCRTLLADGIRELGLSLGSDQTDKLVHYLNLMVKWNRAYNLTAITDPEAMVRHHLLDSLALVPHLSGNTFVDVGTGAGLPGVPLAVAMPECRFTLLDSNGKRIRFLFQVRTELGLGNILERQARVETFRPDAGFDGVISRAFTSLGEMVAKSGHLLRPGGRFYAMKGQYPEKELRELEKPYNVFTSHRLAVPGLEGQRHLIIIASSAVGGPS